MTSEEERQMLERLERRAKARKKALDGEEEEIVAALRMGIHKAKIVKAIDRSRTHIDRIAEAHGIPGRYPPRRHSPQDPAEA